MDRPGNDSDRQAARARSLLNFGRALDDLVADIAARLPHASRLALINVDRRTVDVTSRLMAASHLVTYDLVHGIACGERHASRPSPSVIRGGTR